MEWNRSSPTDIANGCDPELIPPFLFSVPFPSVRCASAPHPSKKNFLLPSLVLLFRVRLPSDLMKRCQTEKSFRCICIVYSTEYF